MRDGMLGNAHANGRGFTAKVSQGRRVHPLYERTNRLVDRQIPNQQLVSFPFFFSLSLSFFPKFCSGDGTSTEPKVIAREKNTMQQFHLLIVSANHDLTNESSQSLEMRKSLKVLLENKDMTRADRCEKKIFKWTNNIAILSYIYIYICCCRFYSI